MRDKYLISEINSLILHCDVIGIITNGDCCTLLQKRVDEKNQQQQQQIQPKLSTIFKEKVIHIP
jgi:hypothetical protein